MLFRKLTSYFLAIFFNWLFKSVFVDNPYTVGAVQNATFVYYYLHPNKIHLETAWLVQIQ